MPRKSTALVQQKKNKERVNVFLDGEFAFGLAMIEGIKLKKGQLLTDAEIEHLKQADTIHAAHDRALNFLSYRPRSAEEVRRNLRSKDVPESAIEIVLERLERAGLVDDDAFARFWIENRERFKPRGERALRYELREKGVPDNVIDLALENLDEETLAYRAGEARVRRYAQSDKRIFRKRLGDYLARRGFSYRVIGDVADRLWAEYGDPPDEDDGDLNDWEA